MQLVDRGAWLRFAVRYRRSLIFVGNVGSAVASPLARPATSGMTFLFSDRGGVSTPKLNRRLAESLGKGARCWSVTPRCLRVIAAAAGYGENARPLLTSLILDASIIRNRLSWHAPHDLDEGFNATARWFRGASA